MQYGDSGHKLILKINTVDIKAEKMKWVIIFSALIECYLLAAFFK